MGFLDEVIGTAREVYEVVSNSFSATPEDEFQITNTDKNLFTEETNLPCSYVYGAPGAPTLIENYLTPIKADIESAFYRDFFFLTLKPAKLRPMGDLQSRVPFFVFKMDSKSPSRELSNFLKRAFADLATELAPYISEDTRAHWLSCSFEGPFTFMLDNVSQEFSHSNEYNLSHLASISNFLSETAGSWVQLFLQENTQQLRGYIQRAGDFFFNLIRNALSMLGTEWASALERAIQSMGQGWLDVVKVMASGGRFDSPKVWNSSSSQLSLTATINLVADTVTPDTIARRIIEPLVILWALSIPRGFERTLGELEPGLRRIAKYFYIWPYYVEATLYRGHPQKEESIQILKIPAALRAIRTSFSQENARYRGESITALKVIIDLDPVYNVVYGTLDNSSAMMTFGWFLKNSLAQLAKIKKPEGC